MTANEPAPTSRCADRLFGWTPFRAAFRGGDMLVDWCHLGLRRMTEPFFYETLAHAMRDPFNLVFQQRTSAATLEELPRGLPPLGFIFHMSRCGSTLVAQALAALEAAVVVSEAAALRAPLTAMHRGVASPEQAGRWLASLVNAYAQPRFSYERGLFVKFMAADVLDLELIRAMFPDVPWLFLYRDPLEILASQMVTGGADTMPGGITPQRLGLAPDALAGMTWEDHQFHAMAAFGRAALAEHRPGGLGMILDYAALPAALEAMIPRHFGFAPDAGASALIRAAAMRDSKAPRRAFQPDGAAKRTAAAPWAAAAAAIAGPTHEALARAAARP